MVGATVPDTAVFFNKGGPIITIHAVDGWKEMDSFTLQIDAYERLAKTIKELHRMNPGQADLILEKYKVEIHTGTKTSIGFKASAN